MPSARQKKHCNEYTSALLNSTFSNDKDTNISSSNLNFTRHVDLIIRKGKQMVGFIYRNSRDFAEIGTINLFQDIRQTHSRVCFPSLGVNCKYLLQ